MFSTVIANKYTELYRNLPCCFLESPITTLVNKYNIKRTGDRVTDLLFFNTYQNSEK